MLRVALLTASFALLSPGTATALAPADAPAPAVQRPGAAAPAPAEPAAPAIQRPGASLSPGTAAPAASPDLSAGTASPDLSAGTASPDLSAGTAAPTPAPSPVTPRPTVRRSPASGPQPGVVEVPEGGPKPDLNTMPRYYRAPFSDAIWPALMGREVLMVLGSGARECVTLSKKTPDALFYVHRKNGKQQAPLSAVTSLHEHSWECKQHDSTPSEWARSGAAVGLGLSAIGLVMGSLYDIAHRNPRCEHDNGDNAEGDVDVDCGGGGPEIPHFAYSVVGVTMTTLGTPVVAIGGRSTSRDLRVQGKIWARATGWTLYAGATLMNILWLAGFYGDVESLQVRGLTTGAGVLGLGGAAFMSVDALMSRNELIRLRREDTQRADKPTARAGRGLRLGAAPIGQGGQMTGFGVGLGGRF